MATEAVESTDLSAGRPTTIRPGVVNRLLTYIDRLPGPAALWWLVIGAILALVGHLFVWASAERQFPDISHDVFVPAMIVSWFGWLIHTLNRVATSSFNDFRPALGDPDSEARALASLTTIRDRNAAFAGIIAVVVVASFYYLAVRPLRQVIPPEIERVSAPIWGIATFLLGIVILHTINQLKMVSQLSAAARNVDIFRPSPINAFARLTAVTALGLIAFVVGFVIFSPEQPIVYIVEESALLAIAAASFLLPLRVMHNRLVIEKTRLIGDSQERLKHVLGRIHDAVDKDDLSDGEQLNQSLAAILSERTVLEGLRTWPWSTGVIRGFSSALLIPIALIVLSQVLDRLI